MIPIGVKVLVASQLMTCLRFRGLSKAGKFRTECLNAHCTKSLPTLGSIGISAKRATTSWLDRQQASHIAGQSVTGMQRAVTDATAWKRPARPVQHLGHAHVGHNRLQLGSGGRGNVTMPDHCALRKCNAFFARERGNVDP